MNENGTEAAAATGITVSPVTLSPDIVAVTIDRPFLVAIVDRATKAVLFVGRILEPKAT